MTENVSFGKVYGTTVYAPKLKSPKKLAKEFFPEFSEFYDDDNQTSNEIWQFSCFKMH